ncbi:MAG TPA: hypothetical protein G4N98_04120 [Thermoflexia bacterium]|nr:hypothetical protein [Thermoflexia bacterium]
MTVTLRKIVMAEAQSQAQKTLDEARAQAAKMRQQAEGEAEKHRSAILQHARDKAAALRAGAQATAQMEAQKLKLRRRERLLEQIYVQAEEQLPSLPEREDYPERMFSLVREAVQSLPEAATLLVRTDVATVKALSPAKLAALGRELGVELRAGESLDSRLGVLVMTEDGRRTYDNTLAARLERLRDILRTSVYRILMGEEA